ncbi:CobW/P47K Cterminal domain containing protein [Acanthamoeba castellanii str. Neff]|uniref:CobW/P47K Cterminal domain containing protein n=1 Tax=Acanthamoeba castellanii (strain ATCC 30010 / Neff) TaxID=1257118 RepID=L8HAK8_ACACF|nr:CobW/P47K Cterminal domain containing protein [Acanthamoeba castellanii str. Neff]ELR21753.1 CobW/P47K Cterminal domain containing protein [Acanthamoeba castellanii str. Neff]
MAMIAQELNPSAPISRTEYAKVDAASILGIGAFDIDKTLARDEGFLDFRPYRQHDSRIQSVTLRSEGEYAMVDLQRWVGLLLRERGAAILRSKGVVHAQGGRRFVLQGVHSTFAFEPNDHVYVQARNTKNATADADVSSAAVPKTNRFVFIGRDLHPRDLLAHYQRHLKQNEAGDVSSGGDERVPSVRVEAWTGATAGGGQGASVGGRWVSSLVVFGILYAFSRYRHAVTDALGLPSEWAWLLVVVALSANSKKRPAMKPHHRQTRQPPRCAICLWQPTSCGVWRVAWVVPHTLRCVCACACCVCLTWRWQS